MNDPNKSCSSIQSLFPDAEAGELAGANGRRFQSHLENCNDCASAWTGFLAAVREAEAALRGPVLFAPPEGAPTDYWHTFLPRLRGRIAEENPGTASRRGRRTRPVWAVPAAAALVLGFCLGALVGMPWSGDRPLVVVLSPEGPDSQAIADSEYFDDEPVWLFTTEDDTNYAFPYDLMDTLDDEQLEMLVEDLLGEIS